MKLLHLFKLDLVSDAPLPWSARLAYLGLVPMGLLMVFLWLLRSPALIFYVANALVAYAALVCAFLGGIHWGATWHYDHQNPPPPPTPTPFDLNDQPKPSDEYPLYLGAFLPAVGAWLGMLMHITAGLPWIGFVLLLSYGWDRFQYPKLGLSHWLPLRFRLTLIAAFCCFFATGAVSY